MKEVAEGLRKSGNYGTAHVYRSSMNAIIAFNGSRNLSFKKVNQEFLKSFETYLREKDCQLEHGFNLYAYIEGGVQPRG